MTNTWLQQGETGLIRIDQITAIAAHTVIKDGLRWDIGDTVSLEDLKAVAGHCWIRVRDHQEWRTITDQIPTEHANQLIREWPEIIARAQQDAGARLIRLIQNPHSASGKPGKSYRWDIESTQQETSPATTAPLTPEPRRRWGRRPRPAVVTT